MFVIVNWRDRDHPESGGAELVCEELASRIAARGHEVVLLTSRPPGAPATELRAGFRIVRRGGKFTVYPLALVWLFLHRRRIDSVLDSQNGIPFFSPIAVGRNVPIVMLLHHIHQDQFGQYFPKFLARVGQILESTVSRVVYGRRRVAAVSPSTRRDARQRLGLRGDIHVVPPGCDIPITLRPHLERAEAPRIVCVGRLVPHKRTELIVEAVEQLRDRVPDLELHIVGDGPARARLEALVAERGLGDRVVLHGPLPSHERDALVATAWLTVNASHGEGWGLSVIEANAMGIPVVAFRRPGLRDSIRNGRTGWLVVEGESLAATIDKAIDELRDPARADAYSSEARSWVARFSWEEMCEQMLAIVEAERGRLRHQPDDRRIHTDLSVVAHLDTSVLPDGWRPQFRLTDRWSMQPSGLTVLLSGADTESARLALLRAGIPTATIDGPGVRIAVARPVDLIAPELGSLAVASGDRSDSTLVG